MKFKKTKMFLCALFAVFFSFAFIATPVEAKTAFDANYYFIEYPDVAAVYGFNPEALFNHYQAFGMKEGRFPNQQAEWRYAAGIVDTAEARTAFLMKMPAPVAENANSKLPKLDPIYYYNTYPDIAAVIGTDPIALLQHYFAYGYSEGRHAFYNSGPCVEVQTSF